MELLFAGIFGLAIGSFLNVCIARLPLGVSIVTPRSRCVRCRNLIRWYDNIPLLSWFLLAGRCRVCRRAISPRYPIVEAFTGAISVALFLQYGLSVAWGAYFAFCSAMIVLVLIDLDHRILPDVITLNGIWIGILVMLYLAPPSPFAERLFRLVGVGSPHTYAIALTASVAGVLAGGGLLWFVREAFFRIRGIEGMGFGDVKMMAMVGAFLGLPLTLLTIMLGSVMGSLIGLTMMGLWGKGREYELPFGTFLGVGAVVALLYGNDILRAYFDTFFPAIG